jgi:hypothetical protein
MRFLRLIGVIVSISVTLPNLTFATPITFQERRADFEFTTEYFQTDSNYDPSPGSFFALPANNSFSHWKNLFKTQFAFTNRLIGFAELGYGLSDSLTNDVARNTTGITHYSGGMRYLLWHDVVSIVPELSYSISPEVVDPNTTMPLLSNGSSDLLARIIVGKITGKTTLYAHLGYQSRSEGLSSLVPWGVFMQLRMRQFLLEGEFRGFENLSDDKYTDNNSVRHNVSSRVNGGSLLFYSVNPSAMEVVGRVGVRFTPKFSALVGYGTTVNGSNYANGQTVVASLKYHFGQAVSSRRQKYYDGQRKSRAKQGLDEFEAETDESDLEFFEREERRILQPPRNDDQILNETEKILSK